VRTYPGALFLSWGGYHHHVGLNTWNSLGAAPPPPGALGLARLRLRLDEPARDAVARRATAAGALADGELVDPSGTPVGLAPVGRTSPP
jgi:catechol 2,3-dioxygenase